MPNPYSQMRLGNIFAPPQTVEEQARKRFMTGIAPPPRLVIPPPEEDQDEGGKYFDELQRIQGTKGPALSAYQKALAEQPTQESTQAGIGRKILGTIAGGLAGFAGGPQAGVNAATDVVERPYNVAMRDYKNRVAGLGESARLEQDETESKMRALSSARALGLKYDEFNLKKMENEREFGLKKDAQALTRGNNESLADYRKRQAESSAKQAATGEKNAETAAAGQKDTARFRTGQLGVSGRNAATGEKNATTAATRADIADRAQKDTADYRKKSLDIRGKAGKTVSPSQQAYAVDNALRELATDPHFAKHIVKGDNGTYEMKEDDGSRVYQEFKKRVKKLAESSIKAGTPFDDEIDDGLDEIEIGKPRGF